jgi:hypothetical protein
MHGSVIKEEHCLSVLDKVSKDLQQKSMT